MKKALLASVLVFAGFPALASLPETRVATCQLGGSGAATGRLEIFSSDNGDEGFLRFAWTVPGSNLGGEFTDNVQDAGAAFLKKGAALLYVSIEGSKSETPAGKFGGVAVYLANEGGKIRGKLKADFLEADLRCTASK